MPNTGQTGPKRRWHEVQADRQLAVFLAVAGYSKDAIAKAVGERSDGKYTISRNTASSDVKAELEKYRHLLPTDIDTARLLQAKRLEEVKYLALDAFVQSTETTTTTTTRSLTPTETEEGKEGTIERVSTARKRSAGDAKFLAIVKEIEVERSKILGVYAPERREEHGELTVVFAWKETPAQLSTAASDAIDGTFRLAESAGSDAGLQPSQAPPDDEN